MPQKQLHDVRRSGHCTTNYERTTLLIHSSITRPTVHILLDCKRELYTKLVARSLYVHITSTVCSHIHTYRLTALCPGLPGSAGTRKVKPIWILLKQETVSGSGISWAICKSAPHSRRITTPAPHCSVFLQAGCPSCRPTNSVKALNTAKYQQQARRARLKAKRTAENVTNTGLNIVLYPAICRTEVFIKTAVQISINILTNSKKICLPSFNGDCQQRK